MVRQSKRLRFGWLALVMIVVLVTGRQSARLFTSFAPQQALPSLAVDPPIGLPGTPATVRVSGLPGDMPVVLTWDESAGRKLTTRTGSDGFLQLSINSPPAAAGSHSLRVTVGIIGVSAIVQLLGGGSLTEPLSVSAAPTAAPLAHRDGLYVATSGSDANPGTLAAPLRTIQAAVRRAQPGTTIVVRGGEYQEEVVFDHGGADGQRITLQNYPGERAIIDGSLDVTGWTPVSGTVWKASFTHVASVPTSQGPKDAASESTCPDGFSYSGDRRAYLYVDDTPDQSHWLKPLCIGLDPGIAGPADLPRGSFATDVPPPPLPDGQAYAGTTNTIYVNLADGGDPNTHRIRIAAHDHNILFWGKTAGNVTVKGLTLRRSLEAVYMWGRVSDITLDGLDVAVTKLRAVASDFCTSHFDVLNSHIHDVENEAIHLESDNSLVDNNLIERTLAPWARSGAVGINVLGNGDRVARNTIRAIARSEGGQGGFGIFMEEWYDGTGDVGCHAETNQSNIVERNRIHDNARTGIYNSGGDNNTIRNNLVYRNGGSGITIDGGGTEGGPTGAQQNAINNTIVFNTSSSNAGNGIMLSPAAQNSIVRDNILDGNARALRDDSRGAVIDYNFPFCCLGEVGFVDAVGGDFHLRRGSPAIDAGTDVGVTEDLDGTHRPQGAGYDLGAYEYVDPASSVSTPTATPPLTSEPNLLQNPTDSDLSGRFGW